VDYGNKYLYYDDIIFSSRLYEHIFPIKVSEKLMQSDYLLQNLGERVRSRQPDHSLIVHVIKLRRITQATFARIRTCQRLSVAACGCGSHISEQSASLGLSQGQVHVVEMERSFNRLLPGHLLSAVFSRHNDGSRKF
jgi:hypothetical protein